MGNRRGEARFGATRELSASRARRTYRRIASEPLTTVESYPPPGVKPWLRCLWDSSLGNNPRARRIDRLEPDVPPFRCERACDDFGAGRLRIVNQRGDARAGTGEERRDPFPSERA